jgi:SAM-dependent methyltransferase
MTAAIVAATHPNADVVGIDAMPEHVVHARKLCEQAGIGNIDVRHASFGSPALRALPQFEYIVAHGVYTWVSPAARADLRAFVDRHLKPGGLVYLSYNAMPGWAADVPLQRLLRELAAAASGDSVARFAAAAAVAATMTDAGARALLASPMARSGLAKRRETLDRAYFPHEYLLAAWQPLYVTDVRALLQDIGLTPVGSATTCDNFDSYTIGRRGREVLATLEDADLRELARDFFRGTMFRRDVFSRDARAITDEERRTRLFATTYHLGRPAETIGYAMTTPAGVVGFDTAAAHHIVASLAAGPRRLADLQEDRFAAGDLLANTLALCAAGHVQPVAGGAAPVEQLNRILADRVDPFPYRVSPSGTAIRIGSQPAGGRDEDASASHQAEWERFFEAHGMGLPAFGHGGRSEK